MTVGKVDAYSRMVSPDVVMEFDYRLHWLAASSGQQFAVLINAVRAEVRPWGWKYGPTCTVWVQDLATGAASTTTVAGTLGDSFAFSGPQVSTTSAGYRTHTRVESAQLALDLRGRALSGTTALGDVGGEAPGIDDGRFGAARYEVMSRVWSVGELTHHGRRHRVRGYGWRDRHDVRAPLVPGVLGFAWRWFALQLEQPWRAFMVYELWDPILPGRVKRYATLIDERGTARPADDVRVRVLSSDRAAARSWETRWRVQVPSLALDVTLTRLGRDPWVRAHSSSVRHDYAEGPCAIAPQGGVGRAWAEQVDSRWIRR